MTFAELVADIEFYVPHFAAWRRRAEGTWHRHHLHQRVLVQQDAHVWDYYGVCEDDIEPCQNDYRMGMGKNCEDAM